MPGDVAGLAGCERPPAEVFDVALLDLDGVIYLADDPVTHAAESLQAAAKLGQRRAYVTNNALRTPTEVAAKLHGLGVPANAEEIVTSAQAAATILSDRLPPGAPVLVTGGAGLLEAVRASGFAVVQSADDAPAAVVLGYDPELNYRRLAEACLAIRRGALFVACNRDATVPTPRGPLPGMGALAALVTTGSDQEPLVAGKPELALHAESVRRSAAHTPLVVGDRLDTDCAGARRAGTPSLLVLTGVTDVAALCAAPPAQRPDLIAADLRGLLFPHPTAAKGRCGQAVAHLDGARIVVQQGAGKMDGLRAAVSLTWEAVDRGQPVPPIDGLPPSHA